MLASNIAQVVINNTYKVSRNFYDYFKSLDTRDWVNGRPVLLNGDVWCPMCETWHVNNSLCQKPY